MDLVTHIRRNAAEGLLQDPVTGGLQIRLIPRDEWHARRGVEVDPEDKDWYILDCYGPPAQVMNLSHHPALGDPAYLNWVYTGGDVRELAFLHG